MYFILQHVALCVTCSCTVCDDWVALRSKFLGWCKVRLGTPTVYENGEVVTLPFFEECRGFLVSFSPHTVDGPSENTLHLRSLPEGVPPLGENFLKFMLKIYDFLIEIVIFRYISWLLINHMDVNHQSWSIVKKTSEIVIKKTISQSDRHLLHNLCC